MLQLVRSSPQDTLGVADNVVIAIWKTVTRISSVAEYEALQKKHYVPGAPQFLLQIVEPDAAPPDTATRTALAAMLQAGAGRVTKSAVVFEATGLRAVAMRSFVTALTALSRPPFPHQVFASTGLASVFLGLDGNTLTANVASLRAQA